MGHRCVKRGEGECWKPKPEGMMAESGGKEEEGHVEYVQKGRQMNDEEYNRRIKPSLNMIIATMFLSCIPLPSSQRTLSPQHSLFAPGHTLPLVHFLTEATPC